MNRNVNLLLIFFFSLAFFQSLVAQLPANLSILNKSVPQLFMEQTNYFSNSPGLIFYKSGGISSQKNKANSKLKPSPFDGVNARPRAFFCKIEVILEKKNGVPIKFRLGDIDKVDQLEGKFSW